MERKEIISVIGNFQKELSKLIDKRIDTTFAEGYESSTINFKGLYFQNLESMRDAFYFALIAVKAVKEEKESYGHRN